MCRLPGYHLLFANPRRSLATPVLTHLESAPSSPEHPGTCGYHALSNMSHLIRRTAAELAARHVYRYPPERGVVPALERRVRAEAAHVKADAALFVAPVLGYVFSHVRTHMIGIVPWSRL